MNVSEEYVGVHCTVLIFSGLEKFKIGRFGKQLKKVDTLFDKCASSKCQTSGLNVVLG